MGAPDLNQMPEDTLQLGGILDDGRSLSDAYGPDLHYGEDPHGGGEQDNFQNESDDQCLPVQS